MGVARARADRDEIYRLLNQLSEGDREMLRDVGPSADALFDRIMALTLERERPVVGQHRLGLVPLR